MSLAIIIPAYKIEFLHDSLRSIANQTSKDFTVYIGNDNSPHDLYSLIQAYEGEINIVYQNFPENLGAKSLVKHWERCIAMAKGEEWIWLFSDDDLMDPGAVASFFKMKPVAKNVYRFPLTIINAKGDIERKVEYPDVETAVRFLDNRLQYQYDSAITHYIFSKAAYHSINRFIDFPLAWGSDDAMIIELSRQGELITIDGARISWRISDINISGDFDSDILRQKIAARINYIKWLLETQGDLLSRISNYKTLLANWYGYALQVEGKQLNTRDRLTSGFKFIKLLGLPGIKIMARPILDKHARALPYLKQKAGWS
jgi:glycosyltransferase involved in cell wall biosynthesis